MKKIAALKPKELFYQEGLPAFMKTVLASPQKYSAAYPVLGICYGMQLITHQLEAR
jgi:GMP synthase-like glutamine amidotransferase